MSVIGAIPALHLGVGLGVAGLGVATYASDDDPGAGRTAAASVLVAGGALIAGRGIRQVYNAARSPLIGGGAEAVAGQWSAIRNARVGTTTLADSLRNHVRVRFVGDGPLSARTIEPETRAARRLLDGSRGDAFRHMVTGLVGTRDDASAAAQLQTFSFGHRRAIEVDEWLNFAGFVQQGGHQLDGPAFRAQARSITDELASSYLALNSGPGHITLGRSMGRQLDLELTRQAHGGGHPARVAAWIEHPIARTYAPNGGRTHLARTLGHELEHSLESGTGGDPRAAEYVADLMAFYNQKRITTATGIPIDFASTHGFHDLDGADRLRSALAAKGMDDVAIYQYFNGKPIRETVG